MVCPVEKISLTLDSIRRAGRLRSAVAAAFTKPYNSGLWDKVDLLDALVWNTPTTSHIYGPGAEWDNRRTGAENKRH